MEMCAWQALAGATPGGPRGDTALHGPSCVRTKLVRFVRDSASYTYTEPTCRCGYGCGGCCGRLRGIPAEYSKSY